MKGKSIPHFRPSTDGSDIRAVVNAIKSGQLSNGPWTRKLEDKVAKLSGKKYGIAVTSGTTAIHLALLALDVGYGDEVIMPSYVCVGLAHATRQIGAIPVLVDVNEEDGNMNSDSLRRALTKKTKVIIIPHMFGLMADIHKLRKIAKNIPVIEDCAMSIGAEVNGNKAGSFGDISIFSFYATKMVAGGEGGVITTSNKLIKDELEDLREYDKKLDSKIRYNYKLSELNSALAVSQLSKLNKFINRRNKIAKFYLKEFSGLPVLIPQIPKNKKHTFYRFVIRAKKSGELREYLRNNGIIAGYGVIGGIHKILNSKINLPSTSAWLNEAVSLPIYPSMKESDVIAVVKLVKRFYANI